MFSCYVERKRLICFKSANKIVEYELFSYRISVSTWATVLRILKGIAVDKNKKEISINYFYNRYTKVY